MASTGQDRRMAQRITALMAFVFLVPSLFGFGSKLIELFKLVRGEVDGAFAIAPVMNYVLASTGFFFLLMWATTNGMFRDIEEPKRALLTREAELDRRE